MRGRPDRKTEELRQAMRLHHLPKKRVDELSALVVEATFTEGSTLALEGSLARQTFFILEGEAEVVVGGQPVARLGPGQFVGEMGVLDRRPRTATVHATTDLRVFVIDPGAFATFVAEPAVAKLVATGLSQRLRQADEAVVATAAAAATT